MTTTEDEKCVAPGNDAPFHIEEAVVVPLEGGGEAYMPASRFVGNGNITGNTSPAAEGSVGSVSPAVALEGELVPAPDPLPDDPAHTLMELLVANVPAAPSGNRLRLRDQLGKQLPADADPVILKRRAIAMPLWNQGLTANEITMKVNDWLKELGLPPVTVSTIRDDHKAVFADWEDDYSHSSAENLAGHLATLQRIKYEAWRTYEFLRDKGKQGGGSAAAFLKLALSAEEDLAMLDGSKKRADLHAQRDEQAEGDTKILRLYVGVDTKKIAGPPPGKD